MHHHGKGVYSGTFSGTLNPALQDRHGRPKRDISTIIHILNDLLCATPATTAGHYRHHHRHSSTRQISSSNSTLSASSSATGNGMSTAACLESPTPGYSSGVFLLCLSIFQYFSFDKTILIIKQFYLRIFVLLLLFSSK